MMCCLIQLKYCFMMILFILIYGRGTGQQEQQQLQMQLQFQQQKQQRRNTSVEVVGFWNIYAEGPYYKQIIDEQYRVLQSSGLLDQLTKLYYITMGQEGYKVHFPSKKLRLLKYFLLNGDEIRTLQYIQQYCSKHSTSKVLYFHNKGSYNYDILNINMRRALDCFVLNTNCIDILEDYDTCGWRLSPLPHIHYSGNYWWSTCQHINKLIPPIASKYNKTFLSYTALLYKPNTKWGLPSKRNPFPDQPYLGLGRYFAETWIGSKPWFKPADCMNASANNRYMWGKFPLPWRMLNKRCPNFHPEFMNFSLIQGQTLHYGLYKGCGLAGMIKQPELMQQRFQLSIRNFTPELYDRSMYWYGQPPSLHLQWLSLYK